MSLQPDELRNKLTAEVRENILRDNWFSHDARWFLKVSQELGFDEGNRFNQMILKSMAKTDMKRILRAVDCQTIESPDDVAAIFQIALELYFPSPWFEGEFRVTGADSAMVTVKRCHTLEEVQKAGILGVYQCPCAIRFESWLAACRLSGAASILTSMMRGDPLCEISLSSISRLPDNGTSNVE